MFAQLPGFPWPLFSEQVVRGGGVTEAAPGAVPTGCSAGPAAPQPARPAGRRSHSTQQHHGHAAGLQPPGRTGASFPQLASCKPQGLVFYLLVWGGQLCVLLLLFFSSED